MIGTIAWIQSTPEMAAHLEQLAWAETVTAVGTAILALLGLAVTVMILILMRVMWRTLSRLEQSVEQLVPKTEPLIERATQIADDAAEVSRSVREEVDRIQETVGELNEQFRVMARTTEARVRQFGAVMRVVQAEVEELMMDAASTARGVHTTAVELQRRGAAGPRSAGPREDGK